MSRIDFSRIRNLTARQVVRALLKDGFSFERQRGSHHRYSHPDGRLVTVHFSAPSNTFLRRTLHSIVGQAGWEQEDLQRLGLID